MQPTFKPVRLTGLAILAVATATTLSVGACSKSHDEKSAAKPSSPASANGQDSVHGLIASVSGNAVQVTQTTGTVTVDVSPNTKVSEWTNAQLTDVAAGKCVSVMGKPELAPGGAVRARSVRLNQQESNGKCPQPKNAQPRNVVGTVASVTDDIIHVTFTDANGKPSKTSVKVADTTTYTKPAPATSQAIAQGKCMTAHGKKDGNGTLQATVVALAQADNGQCPQAAR